jgi:hypothetical protein
VSVDQILRRQAGVISRAQATGAGMPATTVDRLLARRRWSPVHPRVYLADGCPLGDEARVRAAVLWAGDAAVLAGAAAAWWHGLVGDAPAVVSVAVPGRRCLGPRPGVFVVRRGLDAADGVEHQGIRVTATPLAALEAAVEAGAAGADLIDGLLLRRRVRFDDVLAAHLRNSTAPGSATARLLLAEADQRAARAAGRELSRLLREAGVRGWRADARARQLVLPAARVAVHVHGWLVRCVRPAPPGWTLLHCSLPDLVDRPDAVLTAVARAVTEQAAAA